MKLDIKPYLRNQKIAISYAAAATLCLTVIIYAYLPALHRDFSLQPASFSEIEGWGNDKHKEAFATLARSCERIMKKTDGSAKFGIGTYAGTFADWQSVCTKAEFDKPHSNKSAKEFFERNFKPYAIWGEDGREGLFTGYYEPTLKGSFKKHGKFNIPLYRQPGSLITVNLGDFREEYKGEQIVGRVEGSRLIPYFTREQIEEGAIQEEKAEILWVNNAVDAFFLHIQGSGRVVMEDGSIIRVGYALQNGHPYTAIGSALLKSGALTRDNVSMQSIRAWLETHPDKAAEVMNINASYIFFRELDVKNDGPLGAEGISLTAQRSLAVDRRKIPYGLPIWIDAEKPGTKNNERIRRLMVAQDTGGAIKGSVRGDFFWGSGKSAAENAGIMKSKGQAWLLLPKSVEVPKDVIRKRIKLW